ncbi:Dabb family protein [Clostridium sp. JN-1]|jgi:hypothetical protein|uniref:Dabb family protein n=1 Tax=Clostridium sp. JN-1 TaxID=2483110 RepID=UPI000F0B24D4|nr:Dabb family protein [Clostridium sp. JN-1]
MFTHVVFFKLKDKSPENVNKAVQILKRVDGKVPTLKSVKVGADAVHSARSYDIALIAKFDSKEGMDEYQVHPVHVHEVLDNLKPMLESSAAVDFED